MLWYVIWVWCRSISGETTSSVNFPWTFLYRAGLALYGLYPPCSCHETIQFAMSAFHSPFRCIWTWMNMDEHGIDHPVLVVICRGNSEHDAMILAMKVWSWPGRPCSRAHPYRSLLTPCEKHEKARWPPLCSQFSAPHRGKKCQHQIKPWYENLLRELLST